MADRPLLKNVAAAPILYFDNVPTLGVNNNIVELELSARVVTPTADSKTTIEGLCVAHLRCSLEAALSLRTAIEKAFKIARVPLPEDGKDEIDPSPGMAMKEALSRFQ